MTKQPFDEPKIPRKVIPWRKPERIRYAGVERRSGGDRRGLLRRLFHRSDRRRSKYKRSFFDRLIISVTVFLCTIIGCGMLLRESAKFIGSSDGPQVSKPNVETALQRQLRIAEHRKTVRNDALQREREFMRQRRRRIWQQEAMRRPDSDDAVQTWEQGVQPMRDQLRRFERSRGRRGFVGEAPPGSIERSLIDEIKRREADAPPR